MILGERLSFPSSVFLFPDKKSIFFALDVPKNTEEQGSIGVMRTNLEGIPSVRIELAFPPREHLSGRLASIPGFIPGPDDPYYTSGGNLKRQMQLNVLIAGEKEIVPLVTAFFLKKREGADSLNYSLSRGSVLKLIKEGIDICLNDLVVEKDGAYGPLVSHKSDSISSFVCTGLSYLLQRIFENNFEMNEISLRLADFSLKSQHPSGAFLEYYRVQSKTWSNDEKPGSGQSHKNGEPLYASLAHSAGVADYLFSIAIIQQKKDISAEKYFIAGKRFIEQFFDPKKRGLVDLGAVFVLDTLEPKEKSKLCLELGRRHARFFDCIAALENSDVPGRDRDTLEGQRGIHQHGAPLDLFQ
jgi:hypothetical protein